MAYGMTRRELLRGGLDVAGAVAAARLGLAPAAAAARRQATLGCDTYSFHRLFGEGRLTLEECPALYKELDIPGITFNDMFFKAWDNDTLDHLKATCKEAGIRIQGLVCEGDLATPDEAARRRQVETNLRKMAAAARLGAPLVRLNLGGVGPGEDNATVGVERVIAAFKEMLPEARRLRVRMTIENHGGVSGTADNIERIILGTDRRWVGACLDFGNWPDDVRYQSCEKLAPYAYHTHAKAYAFGPDGEETRLDYGRILGMLKRVRYTGALSIEFEGGGDPIEGVKKTRDLIRKHWPGV